MNSERPKPRIAVTDVALLSGAMRPAPMTWRDMAMPVFRQRRLALIVFLGVFGGALIAALLAPREYQAEMKILVNRDRANTVVTADGDFQHATIPPVSEEDLNSEVELLTSRDLLDEVVLACGLNRPRRPWRTGLGMHFRRYFGMGQPSQAALLAESEKVLRRALTVEPLQKTKIIRVTYASRDPILAARVLRTLASLYEQKHAAVHQPTGTLTFFERQTEHYRDELAAAESQRIQFDLQEHVAAPATEEQLAIEQLSKLSASLQDDQSEVDAAAAREKALRAEQAAIPQRQTTEMRKTGNAQLLANLRSTLLSLELKHTDMLVKYAPSYPPVKDVETQITQTKTAIQAAEGAPVSEVTTDRVPVQDWVATQMAKAGADRAQFSAQAASLRRAIRYYRDQSQRLDRLAETGHDLDRTVKTDEDNYLLYLRKREEARISDALDRQRIVNVAIAEPPSVPALPTTHAGWLLAGGLFTAGFASVGAAYAADRMDSHFRTPDELDRYLGVRVLAAIPRNASST